MKVRGFMPRRWLAVGAIILVVASMILTACTPDASEFLLSPDLGTQIAARDAGEVVVAVRPVEKKLAELTPDERFAGLDPAIRTAVEAADPANGEVIRNTYGCSGCHALGPSTEGKAGPTWYSLGNHAVNRRKGESPAQYLYESIVDPTAFYVDGYAGGQMPQNFAEIMTPEEIATMVAFLLAKTEE